MKFLTPSTILDGLMYTLPSVLLLIYTVLTVRIKPAKTTPSMKLIKVFSLVVASVYLLFSIITTSRYIWIIASKTELTPFNLEGIWYAPVMIVYAVLFAPLIVASVLTYKSLPRKTK